MHYLALYRKYRPSSFGEVVGQDKVINVIKNEILNNRISHAYLFSGPRGTGKTTTAKIISKLVNCSGLVNGEACGKCDNCLNFKNSSDIVEIDAASNNGVDEIRELRDKVNLVPTSSKYKVYIIDEVHMLTTQAFNALLKTLEEPPAHAIFILATTEPHKIPLTVASRCQKFQFSKISNDEIVRRLKIIVDNEKIEVSDDILYEISRLSDGGLRDAINMLDQLIAYKDKNITIFDVYNINGSVSYVDLSNFIKNMMDNKVVDIVNFIENVNNEGKSLSKFIEEVIVFLKDVLLYKNANICCDIDAKNDIIKDLSALLDDSVIYNIIYAYNDTLNNMKISSNPLILFVISTLKIVNENFILKENAVYKSVVVENKDDKLNVEEVKVVSKTVKEEVDESLKKVESENSISNEFIDIRINNTFALANKNDLNEIKNNWYKINEFLLDDKYGVNCGILKDTMVVAAGGDYLILTSDFESIVDKVNLKIEELENTLNNIFNKKYNIISLSVDKWEKEKETYIVNIKNGIKYVLKDEIKFNKNEKKERTPVDELIDIIGEDLVEIE